MARRKKDKRASVLYALPHNVKLWILESNSTSKGKENDCEQTQDSDGETTRPLKKRKLNALLLNELERYDATGLVPHYTNAKQVPEHLQKYFFQRHRLFSRYSEGCLLDEEGWFSVTPEAIANQIAERCRCGTVIDAFCGVGGNAIAFAKVCERVIAIDNSATRLALARHNAAVYGVVDRIEFILGDFISFAKSLQRPSTHSLSPRKRPIDVVFLSPPWGGVDYLSMSPSKDSHVSPNTPIHGEAYPDRTHSSTGQEYSLSNVSPLHGTELFQIARAISPNVAYFLPRNQSLEEISALVEPKTSDGGQMVANNPHEIIEIEEEWMGTKLKALTCYFGGLVQGQEHLWDK